MHEKPESSVGYRSICFRSKVRLFDDGWCMYIWPVAISRCLLLCVRLRWKYSKFCLTENHVMKLSAIFRCNERKTKSSVRYRRSCLQAEIRSYLYATWHCVVLKTNEVWIFDTLRFREFCSAQIICRLQWNTFAWTLLLVEFDWYHIFAALCYGKWIWDWFTSVCTFTRKIQKILVKENHDVMCSRLFSCNEIFTNYIIL